MVIVTKTIDYSGATWPSGMMQTKSFYCGFFSGAGAAVRREALNKTRYYPKEYFIFGNERELAAQILNRSYKIKYYSKIETYHRMNPKSQKTSLKSSERAFYHYCRNGLWTIWMHEPMSRLIRRTLGHLYVYFFRSMSQRTSLTYLRSVLSAVRGLPHCIRYREVVTSPYWRITG